MDFLNRAVTQLADLFKSLSPGARITSALLLVVVVVSLAYLFQSHTAGPDAFLMGGEPFASSQLPAMEAAFAKAALSSYQIDGNRIRVPRGQQSLYMGALADDGALPPEFGKYLEKALASGSVFETRAKQQEMLRAAKQNELQLILNRMKGVESAAVLYDEKKPSGFNQPMLSTASVSIKPIGSQPLDKERIPMIRHLVASAFAGLKPENVSVTDLNGKTYASKSDDGGLSTAEDDDYISRKEKYERIWREKIADQLEYIPGVVVTTNVELALDTEYEETKTTLDPKGVVYKNDESNSTKTSEAPAPVGRPGVVAQQPGGANQPAAVAISAGGPKTNEETNRVQSNTAIPTTVQKRRQHGLTPLRVKVAVAIPSSYYDKVWSERNPPPAGQEPKKPDVAALADIERQMKDDIKNAVVALLPIASAGSDPFPQVTVTSFQHITAAPLPIPDMQDHAVAWLGQYGTSLGMGGLALISLWMLRSVARSAPATAPLSSMPAAETGVSTGLSLVAGDEPNPSTAEPEETSTPRARLRRRAASGPSLREELTTMVKEDPDSAVAVLRNWIGAGA